MKAWENLLSSLELELGPDTVKEWLRPIKIARFDAANLYLEATPFQEAFFEEQVRPRIKGFFNNNQRPIKIHWGSKNASKSPSVSDFQLVPDSIEKENTLASFIEKGNEMAGQLAQELATGEKSAGNPIFFSGRHGSGKTHLLMGIAQALSAQGKRVFYVSAKTFTDHVVQAIRLGQMIDFRRIYRMVDALIVDDIHLFARRAATQEEFFHTFNALHTLGRQMVFASLEPANQLEDIEPRLISRFEWGLAIPLVEPDRALLEQILERKARFLDLDLPKEAMDFLLHRFSIQKLSIMALHAIAIRNVKNFEPAFLERALADLLEKEKESQMTADRIIAQTANYFGIRAEDLTGESQTREYTVPRQIAMYLSRKLLNLPLAAIGRLFDRDHSTVISSIKQVKKP